MSLEFKTLREANLARLPTYNNAKGEPEDCESWELLDWLLAMNGEVGELFNYIKKVRRGDFTLAEAWGMLAEELADVVIYMDILAHKMGGNDALFPRSFQEVLVTSTQEETIARNCAFLTWSIGMLAQELVAPHSASPASLETLQEIFWEVNRLAKRLNVNLGEAVLAKFNKTSAKIGSPVRIATGGKAVLLLPN